MDPANEQSVGWDISNNQGRSTAPVAVEPGTRRTGSSRDGWCGKSGNRQNIHRRRAASRDQDVPVTRRVKCRKLIVPCNNRKCRLIVPFVV